MITDSVLVVTMAACLFLPPVVCAGCVDLGNFTSWVATGTHSVLFSQENKFLAFIFVSNCVIHPLSVIVLPKNRVCASDTLMIDGKECQVLNIMAFD